MLIDDLFEESGNSDFRVDAEGNMYLETESPFPDYHLRWYWLGEMEIPNYPITVPRWENALVLRDRILLN